MRLTLRCDQEHVHVELQAEGGQYRVAVEATEHIATVHYLDDATLLIVVDGQQHRVDLARAGRERFVAVDGETYHFVAESGAPAHHVAMVASPEIVAPMPGKVLQVLVHTGDRVAAGDGLLILEAMKMENRLTAEAGGRVSEIRVSAGDMVEGGQVLAVLAYDEAPE